MPPCGKGKSLFKVQLFPRGNQEIRPFFWPAKQKKAINILLIVFKLNFIDLSISLGLKEKDLKHSIKKFLMECPYQLENK